MRKYVFLILPLCVLVVLQAPAQTKKAKVPYELKFDRTKDVEQLTRHEGKEGIFIRVQFAITFDGANDKKIEGDYKIVIEEDGHFVKEVKLTPPVRSEDLSVILALDTSGSMKEHERIEQARVAADVFLKKLPARADCGLILFDHEIRERMPPIFERAPLLAKINVTEPRGGTAYLDAGFEAIHMLRDARRGRDRAVVLMTDGIDLNSKKTVQEVVAQANQDRVRVHTIGIGEPGKFEKVNTVLVLDHSGSMRPPADDLDTTPKIVALHLAAERYLDSMSTSGRVSIVPFSTVAEKPWPFREKNASLLTTTLSSVPANSRPAVSVVSTTHIVAGLVLTVNAGLADEEVIRVDSVNNLARTIVAPFQRAHPAGAKLTGSALPALKNKIRDTLKPDGETALFDATYEAINVLEADNAPGKRAVLAMTDGYDNTSRRRVEEVIVRAKEAKVPLYLLGFGRAGEIDDVTMRNMADSTDGKFYHAKNKNALIEIFENLSIQLHDDGIDEETLKKIATQTGGQYYPAKNVSELKIILEKVTQNMPQKRYPPIVFASLNQRADGTLRNVSLKLVQGSAVLQEETGGYQMRGLIVAEMNHVIYLVFLIAIGGLIALPALLRGSKKGA